MRNGYILLPRNTKPKILAKLQTKTFEQAAAYLRKKEISWFFYTIPDTAYAVNQKINIKSFLIPVIDNVLPDIIKLPTLNLLHLNAGGTVVLRDGTQDKVIACEYMPDDTFDEEFPFFLVLQSAGASTRTTDGRYGSGEESDSDIIDFF